MVQFENAAIAAATLVGGAAVYAASSLLNGKTKKSNEKVELPVPKGVQRAPVKQPENPRKKDSQQVVVVKKPVDDVPVQTSKSVEPAPVVPKSKPEKVTEVVQSTKSLEVESSTKEVEEVVPVKETIKPFVISDIKAEKKKNKKKNAKKARSIKEATEALLAQVSQSESPIKDEADEDDLLALIAIQSKPKPAVVKKPSFVKEKKVSNPIATPDNDTIKVPKVASVQKAEVVTPKPTEVIVAKPTSPVKSTLKSEPPSKTKLESEAVSTKVKVVENTSNVKQVPVSSPEKSNLTLVAQSQEISNLKKELKSTQERLAKSEADFLPLQNELVMLRNSNKVLTQSIVNTQLESKNYKTEIQILHSKLQGEIQKAAKVESQKIDSLNASLDHLTAEKIHLNSVVERLTVDNQRLVSNADHLSLDNKHLNTSLIQLKEQLANQKHITDLKNQENSHRIQALKDAHSTQVKNLSNDFESKQEKLEGDLKREKFEKESHQMQLKLKLVQCEKSDKEAANAKAINSKSLEQLEALKKERDLIAKKLSTSNAVIEEFKAKVKTLEANAVSNEALDKANQKVKELEKLLKTAIRESEAFQVQVEEVTLELNNQKHSNESLVKDLESETAEVVKLTGELQAAKASIATHEFTSREFVLKYKEYKQEIIQLKAELAAVDTKKSSNSQEEVASLKKKLKEVTEHVEKLQKMSDGSKTGLTNYKAASGVQSMLGYYANEAQTAYLERQSAMQLSSDLKDANETISKLRTEIDAIKNSHARHAPRTVDDHQIDVNSKSSIFENYANVILLGQDAKTAHLEKEGMAKTAQELKKANATIKELKLELEKQQKPGKSVVDDTVTKDLKKKVEELTKSQGEKSSKVKELLAEIELLKKQKGEVKPSNAKPSNSNESILSSSDLRKLFENRVKAISKADKVFAEYEIQQLIIKMLETSGTATSNKSIVSTTSPSLEALSKELAIQLEVNHAQQIWLSNIPPIFHK
ncbi:hypothetical protein HDV02_006100 [Globomyces sp. JEL0801]|nr:hypothetical protein HDV02_006100 [Globomyces sp. JEL0801]